MVSVSSSRQLVPVMKVREKTLHPSLKCFWSFILFQGISHSLSFWNTEIKTEKEEEIQSVLFTVVSEAEKEWEEHEDSSENQEEDEEKDGKSWSRSRQEKRRISSLRVLSSSVLSSSVFSSSGDEDETEGKWLQKNKKRKEGSKQLLKEPHGHPFEEDFLVMKRSPSQEELIWDTK